MSTKVKRPPQHPAASVGRAAQLPAGAQSAVPSPRASRRASAGGASSPGAARHRGAQRRRDSSRQLSRALCRSLFPEQLPLRERFPRTAPGSRSRTGGPAARTELPVPLRSQPGPPHVPCAVLLLDGGLGAVCDLPTACRDAACRCGLCSCRCPALSGSAV